MQTYISLHMYMWRFFFGQCRRNYFFIWNDFIIKKSRTIMAERYLMLLLYLLTDSCFWMIHLWSTHVKYPSWIGSAKRDVLPPFVKCNCNFSEVQIFTPNCAKQQEYIEPSGGVVKRWNWSLQIFQGFSS